MAAKPFLGILVTTPEHICSPIIAAVLAPLSLYKLEGGQNRVTPDFSNIVWGHLYVPVVFLYTRINIVWGHLNTLLSTIFE